jgi:uncharacterized protein YciI
MPYFFFKLLPPRPTFPADITPEEAGLMQQHVVYWRGKMAEGQMLAFGPVADPRGAFGIGLLRLPDGADPQSLVEADPVVAAGVGFRCEVHPMPSLVLPEART